LNNLSGNFLYTIDMSLFFILNNIHFAIGVFGALAFLTAAWFAFDSYLLRRNTVTLSRSAGFCLLALWQLGHSFVSAGGVAAYTILFLYVGGLLLILLGFMLERPVTRPKVEAVLILPALATVYIYVHAIVAVLYFLIFFLSYRQYKRGSEKALKPFWIAFLLLSVGALFSAFSGEEISSIIWIIGHLFELLGFLALLFWVWQYIGLRVREELVLIFTSSALIISIVVTLAFSIILVEQIEKTTRANLRTSVKVLDLYIGQLKEEVAAKTRFLAQTTPMASLLASEDFSALEELVSEKLTEENLGFLTIVDAQGNVVMRAARPAQRGDSLSDDFTAQKALSGSDTTDIAFSSVEGFSVRSGAPLLKDGTIVGAIVAGALLDNALADSLKRTTGLEISILAKDVVVATTLFNPDGRTRSVGIQITDQSVLSSVLERGEDVVLRTEIVSRPTLASYLPLKNAEGNIVGALSSLKPQQEILDIANATNRLTLITVIILMLILALPIFLVTKRISNE